MLENWKRKREITIEKKLKIKNDQTFGFAEECGGAGVFILLHDYALYSDNQTTRWAQKVTFLIDRF